MQRAIQLFTVLVLIAVTVRILVGLQGYSGQATPPKFGDYEAQRHWMELALHTPLQEWYVETPTNPLHWWGIDYPPGSAYQSYLTGLFMHAAEPESVALETSRGYESDRSKSAMRTTVLLADLLILFPALAAAAWAVATAAVPTDAPRSGWLKGRAFMLTFGVAILQPGLIIIDHGHFQYNGIALGLTAGAVAAVLHGWHIVAAVLYVLSINHKHMLVYFAPAFFAYLLGCCLRAPGGHSAKQDQPWRWRPLPQAAAAVAALGVTVIATMLVVWAPFLAHEGLALKVLQRLVPVQRGLFEDYVANFWCSTHPLVKWKRLLPQQALVRLALGATVTAFTPACLHQVLRPSRRGFLYCLTNTAFAFYMFSYQVHEKSVLMPMLPLALLYVFEPAVAAPVLPLAPFSMFPLLERDGQLLPYIALTACAAAVAPDLAAAWPTLKAAALQHAEQGAPAQHAAADSSAAAAALDGSVVPVGGEQVGQSEGPVPLTELLRQRLTAFVGGQAFWMVYRGSCAVAVGLHVARVTYMPPERIQFLHDLLMTVFAFAHFAAVMLYCNLRQLTLPAPAVGL
eukprot:jgi/Ulvmu1/11109/UM070_0025.1